MTIKTKANTVRSAAKRAAATLSVVGLLAASAAITTPVFADQPTFAASSLPISGAFASSAIVDGSIASPVATTPIYETIGSGMASYYGKELAGNRTASGERFNPAALTAAHRTLPLGSKIRVTNPKTGDSVIVRINDRGPFHSNRLIDLSEAAARQVGIRASGSGVVELSIAAE